MFLIFNVHRRAVSRLFLVFPNRAGIRLDACDVSSINYTPYKASRRTLSDRIGGLFDHFCRGDINPDVNSLGSKPPKKLQVFEVAFVKVAIKIESSK